MFCIDFPFSTYLNVVATNIFINDFCKVVFQGIFWETTVFHVNTCYLVATTLPNDYSYSLVGCLLLEHKKSLFLANVLRMYILETSVL